MSTQQANPQPAPEQDGREPSEQELRAAYEAEMRRLTSADMLLQATVSLLNIGGYRLGLAATETAAGAGAGTVGGPDEQVRDLEQVRDAIDGAKALLPILERRLPQELRPLRDALSQLQMAYAREAAASQPTAAQAGERTTPGQAGTPAQTKTPTVPDGGADGADEPQAQTPRPGAPADAEGEPGTQPKQPGPGPAETSGRLWVPGR